MTEKPIVRAAGGEALLNLLPVLVGFTPRESLVVVGLRGDNNLAGFCARSDLPTEQSDLDAVIGQLAAAAAEHGGDRVAVVSLSANASWAAHALRQCAGAIDKPLELIVWASQDRYWELGAGHPEEGVPWEPDPAHPAVVEAIVEGANIVADRDELRRYFEPERPTTKGLLPDVTEDCLQRIEAGEVAPIEDLLARDSHSEGELLILALLICDPEQLIRATNWPRFGANARRFAELWTRAGKVAPEPFVGGCFALASFGFWLAGDGARALVAADASREYTWNLCVVLMVLDLIDDQIDPHTWPECLSSRSA